MSAPPIYVGTITNVGLADFRRVGLMISSDDARRIPANWWVCDSRTGAMKRILQSRTYSYFELRVMFDGGDE
jgi:hypothetical protein